MDTRKGCYGSSQWLLVSLAAKCRPNIRVFCVLKRDEWMMLIRKNGATDRGPSKYVFHFFRLIYHESLHVGFHDFHSHFCCSFLFWSLFFSSMFFICALVDLSCVLHSSDETSKNWGKRKQKQTTSMKIKTIFQSLDSPVFPKVKREDNRMGRIRRSTTDFDDVATAVAARFTGNLDPSKLSAGFAGMNLDAIWWPLEDFGDGSFIFSFIFFRQE